MDRHPGYTAGSLCRTYRAAREWGPDRDFIRVDWCTILTARQWLEWFRECLEKKVQSAAPKTVGRKMSAEWQAAMRRCANQLSQGIATRTWDIPPEYRERLAHRVCTD